MIFIPSLWQFVFIFLFSLAACQTVPTRTLTICPVSDLSALSDASSYDALLEDYSVTAVVRFPPNQEEILKSIQMAREGVNYEAPEKKMDIRATLWDLPLVKAFLAEQKETQWSKSSNGLQQKLLDEHKSNTLFIVSVVSHREDLFDVNQWNAWLVDKNEKTHLPEYVDSNRFEEVKPAVDQTLLGRKTLRPSYNVFHTRVALTFTKMDLPSLSPLVLVLKNPETEKQEKFRFIVKGTMPRSSDRDHP